MNEKLQKTLKKVIVDEWKKVFLLNNASGWKSPEKRATMAKLSKPNQPKTASRNCHGNFTWQPTKINKNLLENQE